MKKVFVCVLSLIIALSLFVACGKNTGTDTDPTNAASDEMIFKTIGDALATEKEEFSEQSATYENVFVYVFEKDGTYWRLVAELSDDEAAALSALDILDEDYAEKEKALISPLAVTKCENLNEQMLSDDDRAALVGKTGAELLSSGWTSGMGYNLDSMEFYWDYGPFEYTVTFEKQEQLENTDDFDEEAAVAQLKVTSVAFSGLGNSCTDLPEYMEDAEDDTDGSAVDYLVLVNKQNMLPDGWEDEIVLEEAQNTIPEGVELNADNDYLATDVFKVETRALEAFRALQADLEEEGIIILLDSTYRSVARQEELWAEFEEKYGLEYTQNTVAVPGTSEHHTGLAIDVCIVKDGVVINENDAMIAEREIFSKIHEKLADHGFILRFPEDGKEITGYDYEPWHFRYIDSPEIAHEIMDGGLTLEEYLGYVPETTE